MNKFKLLLIVIFACVLALPIAGIAEEDVASNTKEKATIYLFRGEGCSHCAEFLSWIDEIKPEYGEMFEIKDYEVWNNTDNQELMEKVASARNEEVGGVPYIIIGDHSWNGFDAAYKTEMLEEIESLYNTSVSERYDIMNNLDTLLSTAEKNDNRNSIIAIIIIILVVGGIVFGICQARKKAL